MLRTGELHSLAIAWTYLEQFGFVRPPPVSDPEVVRNIAVALLTAANGDGHLSDEERAWIVGYFAAKGYPPEVISEAQSLSPTAIDAIPELMRLGILRKSARILIYDAIRAASVDGFHPKERDTVLAVAEALGIDAAAVAEIERLVEDESAIRERRIRLLMPEGHPNLHPRYQPRAAGGG
jgi:uncharacterized membrane protein YebE (DUF533 family)